MKKNYLYLMIVVVSMFLALAGCGSQSGSVDGNTGGETSSNSEELTEAPTDDQTKELNWQNHVLTLEELRDMNDDDHFSVKEAPEDSRYVVVKLISADSEIPMDEITEETTKPLVLKDSDGGEYEPGMWVVWGVEFDAKSGFSTKETQEGFNLIYLVPKTIETENLHLEMN